MTFDSAAILIDELRARIETGSNQDKEVIASPQRYSLIKTLYEFSL